jgi:hypothetical protein
MFITHLLKVRYIIILSSIFLLFGCDASKAISSNHQDAGRNHSKGQIPEIYQPVLKELKKSSTNIQIPTIVPKPYDHDEVISVTGKLTTDGYIFDILSKNPQDSMNSPSPRNYIATISGSASNNENEDYLAKYKNQLQHTGDSEIWGTKVELLNDKFKHSSEQVITWNKGTWKFICAGRPYLLGQDFEFSSIGVAISMIQNIDQYGLPKANIQKGYVEDLYLDGNRPYVELSWTYDNKAWYSINGFDLNKILELSRSLEFPN